MIDGLPTCDESPYSLRMHANSEVDFSLIPDVVEVLRLLADETRARLVIELLDAELSVGELTAIVDKATPAVSQHLARLRHARLVTTRRDGNHVYYRLHDDHVAQLVIDALRHAEHGRPGTPRHHTADEHTDPRVHRASR